jgi:hypothetical protein
MGSDGANDNSTSVGVVHGNNQNIMNVLAQINLMFFYLFWAYIHSAIMVGKYLLILTASSRKHVVLFFASSKGLIKHDMTHYSRSIILARFVISHHTTGCQSFAVCQATRQRMLYTRQTPHGIERPAKHLFAVSHFIGTRQKFAIVETDTRQTFLQNIKK